MGNFRFLRGHFRGISEPANKAEKNVSVEPRLACISARLSLETGVKWLYRVERLQEPYDPTLNNLIQDQEFRRVVGPTVWAKLHTIRKLGNKAAHSLKPPSPHESLHAVKELWHFAWWLASEYGEDPGSLPAAFDEALVPTGSPVDEWKGKAQALEEKLEADQAALDEKEGLLSKTAAELERALAELAAIKAKNAKIQTPHDYNEAETRRFLIDLLLKEAGWDPGAPDVREFPVSGMPLETNPTGKGSVDYVLWGDNGLPLAVVEAKRSTKDPKLGKHQASLYADCLETAYGRRPVIFYSNGYKHYLWDDAGGYPPREVSGFYQKASLEYLIGQRGTKTKPSEQKIDQHVTGRWYQMEAIRRVSERFEAKDRSALIVMATGTGKTRTTVSLVDVLMKAGWVKRVLFLADRNALVTQAQNAFKEHLPSVASIDLTKEKAKDGSRLVFSTYPTIMNQIDRFEGDERFFGPGYFDLIVVDEAHRSVYQKYRAIFEYFDSLLLGLTATPRDEVDWNTYGLFDQKSGEPTFYYELDQAVADRFLVPAAGYAIDLKFPTKGIRYDELSEEEREKYEIALTDPETGEIPDLVDAGALNSWLFNSNTVDEALRQLLDKGLKVDDGDTLGKTIIFARNHNHAVFIQERFDKNRPDLGGTFARVIDNYERYAQDLIGKFSIKESHPQIAISVDMLDTGIDVPEILNLVYFKPVRSKVKFNQMLGRGTRLCEDLFGPGKDKSGFRVFDFCGNFAFFRSHPPGNLGAMPESISAKIFKGRLEALGLLGSDEARLRGALTTQLLGTVAGMERTSVQVRGHAELVDRYSKTESWSSIPATDRAALAHHVAGLPTAFDLGDIDAKRFDLLCVRLQLGLLTGSADFASLKSATQMICEQLVEKTSIPMVAAKLDLLQEVQKESYWEGTTAELVEDLRVAVRDLTKFLDKKGPKIPVYSHLADEVTAESGEVTVPGLDGAESLIAYRKRVEAYLNEHQDHPSIWKLHEGLPLSAEDISGLETVFFSADCAGGPEQYLSAYQERVLLGIFIRRLVGLSRDAAKAALGDFLDDSTYSARQIHFVNMIVENLTRNGLMDPGLLYEPPFTDLSDLGLDGLFRGEEADRLIESIRTLNQSAAITPSSLQDATHAPQWAVS